MNPYAQRPYGIAVPAKTLKLDGDATVEFFDHPATPGQPWPDAEALLAVLKLDIARANAYLQVIGATGTAINIVRAPGRVVRTLAPHVAAVAVDGSLGVNAITHDTASIIHAALVG